MAKYSKKASDKVKKALHERKRGTLKSGQSGKKVKSRKQAIAIGLAQAWRAVPAPRRLARNPHALQSSTSCMHKTLTYTDFDPAKSKWHELAYFACDLP